MPKQLNEFAADQPELGAEPSHTMSLDGEVDHEGAMAKADLVKLAKYSLKLFKQMNDDDQLEAWVQAKITKAADYIASVYHYLEYEMKFSEYGNKLENSDVYNESEKKELMNKLVEAKEMLRAIKLQQAERLEEGKKSKKADKDYDGDGKVESGKDEYLGSKIAAAKKAGKMDESMGGEPVPCEHCGGTGHTMSPVKSWSPEAKAKAAAYNKKVKAYAAGAKRVDANKNGIPDDEEKGAEEKKPAAKKPAAKKEPAEKKSSSNVGQGIYETKKKSNVKENDEVKGAKKAKQHNNEQDNDLHDDDLDEGRDEGKPGKNFAKIAKKAGKKYGSKAAGERVAGAVRAKLAKQGKLEEGVVGDIASSVSDATGEFFNTDAGMLRKSPQLQQLMALRKKFPDGSPEAKQIDARIQIQKDRIQNDQGEVMGQGGMPKPVLDPATFSKENPNFKYEEINESAELTRMKEFLTRLNG